VPPTTKHADKEWNKWIECVPFYLVHAGVCVCHLHNKILLKKTKNIINEEHIKIYNKKNLNPTNQKGETNVLILKTKPC
jgi:hypothetical protein